MYTPAAASTAKSGEKLVRQQKVYEKEEEGEELSYKSGGNVNANDDTTTN